MSQAVLNTVDLGMMAYDEAYARQLAEHAGVLAAREEGSPRAGVLLFVEHPAVVTISRRPEARGNLLANESQLASFGVSVVETDRGGDITYHGPGQLVAYPILDLSLLNLGLHAYMRLLEDVAIEVCGNFGVRARRETGATGVWVDQGGTAAAKICAMGVRVRKWVSMHGLALNVTTNLDHFSLIVPCGLVGRAVTSLSRELGTMCPSMTEVKRVMGKAFDIHVSEAMDSALAARETSRSSSDGGVQPPTEIVRAP